MQIANKPRTIVCYWCNNDKTDEFDAEEFKPIGLEIGKALKARLSEYIF